MTSYQRALARKNLRYTLWIPIYMATFFLLERLLPASICWNTEMPIDRAIPFCEWFVIPYGFWFLFQILAGICTFRRDGAAFRRYMCFMAITFFSSVLIWVLVPNAQNLRPHVFPRDNLLTDIVAMVYRVDTNTNVFPSVHVVGSIGAALALMDCRNLRHPRAVRFLSVVTAVAICLSTVLIKQHSLLDMLGGLALSAVAAAPVYYRQFRSVLEPV